MDEQYEAPVDDRLYADWQKAGGWGETDNVVHIGTIMDGTRELDILDFILETDYEEYQENLRDLATLDYVDETVKLY